MMYSFRKLVLVLCAAVCLSGCSSLGHNTPMWKDWIFDGPPPGRQYTPLYVKGWQDGCWTAGSAAGGIMYRQFKYYFKQDWKLAQNRVYYKGWRDAFDYCQRILYRQNTQKSLI